MSWIFLIKPQSSRNQEMLTACGYAIKISTLNDWKRYRKVTEQLIMLIWEGELKQCEKASDHASLYW